MLIAKGMLDGLKQEDWCPCGWGACGTLATRRVMISEGDNFVTRNSKERLRRSRKSGRWLEAEALDQKSLDTYHEHVFQLESIRCADSVRR